MREADSVILTGGLILLRTYVFFVTIPLFRQFLGRLGMLSLSVAVATAAMRSSPVVFSGMPSPSRIACLLLTEALCGFLLGAPSALLFESLPQAGRLIDYLRGAMFAEQILPGLEQRVSQLETASFLVVLFILFPLRGYTALVAPLISSFQDPALAPGLGLTDLEDYGFLSVRNAVQIEKTAFHVMCTAIVFASPAFIVLVLFEACLGIASRMAPRIALSQELAPLKLVLGILLYAYLFGQAGASDTVLTGIPRTVAQALSG
ncbi:MAG: flagellar biosynthetic protein FliR [Bdellovibrionota bacterium]